MENLMYFLKIILQKNSDAVTAIELKQNECSIELKINESRYASCILTVIENKLRLIVCYDDKNYNLMQTNFNNIDVESSIKIIEILLSV